MLLVKDHISVVTHLQKITGGHTSALLMNCSVAVFSFSLCPLQALSADACRARPKENVRIQGLAKGQLLMALRWIEASSSLWPPERKAIPVATQNNPILFQKTSYPPKAPSRRDSGRIHACDRGGNSAAQGGDSCHCNFLWAVLGGAAVSSSDHVGFEEGALQVDVVVRHGFVHRSQHLQC